LVHDAKAVLVLIPDFPMLNFLLSSVCLLLASRWLFEATQQVNGYLISSTDSSLDVMRRCAGSDEAVLTASR
jgi:hypothetical protein